MRHVEGPVGSLDSRGQPYMTVFGTSVKPEGMAVPAGQARDSAALAWGDFLDAFADITEGQDVVEWRMFPELVRLPGDILRLAVRARLTAYKEQIV